DGIEPWDWPYAWRSLRYPAQSHLMHHAAGSDALEQAGKRRAPSPRRPCVRHPTEDAGDALGTFSFARLAEGRMQTPWVPRNSRPITGPAQLQEILELAA